MKHFSSSARLVLVSAPAIGFFAAPTPVAADSALAWSVAYTADVFAGASDDVSTRGRVLDNLDIMADVDLDHAFGWRGMTLHAHVLNNSGAALNDDLGTLQGADNIEVSRQRLRLFEFWAEKAWEGGSVRAGLYDLNSEFYANESAGLLVAPAFGIGSELAATGPNGPSIFPSTALAVRGRFDLGAESSVSVAVLNAHAGVLGDPGSVDIEFDDGALLIGEYNWAGPVHLGVGAWGYTDQQNDIRDTDAFGSPISRNAHGFYATAERELWSNATGFARVGVSDGDTTPYAGGWQAGLLFNEVIAARPGSQLSIGAYQGALGDKYRANAVDAGVDVARAETGLELTYSDQLTPWLRVQPDLQLVLDPGGDRSRDNLWVFGVRFEVTPFAEREA